LIVSLAEKIAAADCLREFDSGKSMTKCAIFLKNGNRPCCLFPKCRLQKTSSF